MKQRTDAGKIYGLQSIAEKDEDVIKYYEYKLRNPRITPSARREYERMLIIYKK